MRFNRSIIAQIVFAVIAVLIVLYAVKMVAAFPHWLVDDAFILFRYAENLVEHGELNWNPGENPTEGYTGVTLILLLAAAMKFGASPIVVTHVIGIAAFFCCAALIVLTMRGFNLGSITALALFLTPPFMFAHVWSGLETMLFCAAILFAFLAFTRRRGKLFVASLLVLSLTRPEGAVLSIILLAVYRPFSRKIFLWYVIPAAIYFIWRFAYYGQLLPNTYYVKSASAGIQKKNITMIRTFASTFLPMPALLALIYVHWETVKKHKVLIIGLLAFSLVVLYTYISSELVMTFSYRFLVPFYAIIVIAIGAIVARTPLSFRSAAIVLVIVAPWIVKNAKGRHLKDYKEYCSTHYKMLQDEHIGVGRLLNSTLPPHESIIVHSDAGAIPYYAKRKTIDFGALNDEYLAHQDSSIAEIVDYFYSHNAGALVFTSRDSRRLEHGPEAKRIQQDSRFDKYTLVKKYKSGARRNYFEFLYVRKDLRDYMPDDEIADRRFQLDDRTTHISQVLGDDPGMSPGTEPDTDGGAAGKGVRVLDPDQQSAEELWARAQSETGPAARIRMYRKIVSRFPDHEHAPEALFMVGFIYSEELKKEDLAAKTFEELIKRYPDRTIIETAKWMLENMNKPFPIGEPPDNTDPRSDTTTAGDSW
jgi:hypothetical protein